MISSLWDEYIDDGCSHLTESTRKDHRITKRYYLEALGDHPMGAWSYLCSNKFRDHLKAMPTIKTNEAIKKHQVNLQSFLNWCLLEDVQAINRQIKIKMVQVTKKTPKKYTEEEKQKLMDACFDEYEERPQQLRIYLLARYAIMRRREMWALPKRHIDMDHGVIKVADVNELQFTVKTLCERKIKIHPVLLDFMRKDFKKHPRLYYNDSGIGPYGDPDALTQIMLRMCNRLGIKPKAKILQGLRITGVSNLLVAKKEHVKLAQLAGHSAATMLTSYKNMEEYDGDDLIDNL